MSREKLLEKAESIKRRISGIVTLLRHDEEEDFVYLLGNISDSIVELEELEAMIEKTRTMPSNG